MINSTVVIKFVHHTAIQVTILKKLNILWIAMQLSSNLALVFMCAVLYQQHHAA